MRIVRGAAVLALCWLGLGTLRADLKRAMAESNLEKRSGLAMANAATAYDAARAAYKSGDNGQAAFAIKQIEESVDLAFTSLTQTGKDPRKSPKWFKKAEMETRELMRHLDAFQNDMDFADRTMLDEVKAKVQSVHEKLLLGLMEGKQK